MDNSAWMVRRKEEKGFAKYILDICEGRELDFDKIAVELLNPLRGVESGLRALGSRELLGRICDLFTGKGQRLDAAWKSDVFVVLRVVVGLSVGNIHHQRIIYDRLKSICDDCLQPLQKQVCELVEDDVPHIKAQLQQVLRGNERLSAELQHQDLRQDIGRLRADSQHEQLLRDIDRIRAESQQQLRDFTAKFQQQLRDFMAALQQQGQEIDQLRAELQQQSQDIDRLNAKSQQQSQDIDRAAALTHLNCRFTAGTLHPGTGCIFGAALFIAEVQRLFASAPPEKRREEIELAFEFATSKLGGDDEPLAKVLLRAADEIMPETLELVGDLSSRDPGPALKALNLLVKHRMEGRNLSMALAEESVATALKEFE